MFLVSIIFLSLVLPTFSQDKETCGTWRMQNYARFPTPILQKPILYETDCKWTCMGDPQCNGIDWKNDTAECYLNYDYLNYTSDKAFKHWYFDRTGVCEVECRYAFSRIPFRIQKYGTLQAHAKDIQDCQKLCEDRLGCRSYDWNFLATFGDQCYIHLDPGELSELNDENTHHYIYRGDSCGSKLFNLREHMWKILAIVSWSVALSSTIAVLIVFGPFLRKLARSRGTEEEQKALVTMKDQVKKAEQDITKERKKLKNIIGKDEQDARAARRKAAKRKAKKREERDKRKRKEKKKKEKRKQAKKKAKKKEEEDEEDDS